MPLITDWISSIASLVGGLAGIGALVVAVLSYIRSTRALATDQDVVQSASATLSAVEALAKSLPDSEPESLTTEPTVAAAEEAARREGREGYASALREAREHLETAKSRVLTVTCPHCGERLGPFSRVSPGLVKCGACGKPFSAR